MPSNLIKSWSKKYKVPEKDLEKDWDKAGRLAKKQNQSKNYAYQTAIFKNLSKKDRTEEISMTNLNKFRTFIKTNIELPEDLDSEKRTSLRKDLDEVTTSSAIAVGAPENPVPAGKDFKKVKEPDDIDTIEVDDIDDTEDDERTGDMGVKAGSGYTEDEDINKEDIVEMIDQMDEEEFEEFVSNLDEDETQELYSVLDEYEERNVDPEDIDGSNPPKIGSEDEPDEAGEGKDHTVNKIDIDPSVKDAGNYQKSDVTDPEEKTDE